MAKQVSSGISLCYEGFLLLTPWRLTKGAGTRGNFGAVTQWGVKRPLPSGKCCHRYAGLWFTKR